MLKRALTTVALLMAAATPAAALEAVPFESATPFVAGDGTEVYCVFGVTLDDEGTITDLAFTDCDEAAQPTAAEPDAPAGDWASAFCEAAAGMDTLTYRYQYFTEAMANGTVVDALSQAFLMRDEAKHNRQEFERVPEDAPDVIRRVTDRGIVVTDALVRLSKVADRAAAQPKKKAANTRLLRQGIASVRKGFRPMANALRAAEAQYPALCSWGGDVNE